MTKGLCTHRHFSILNVVIRSWGETESNGAPRSADGIRTDE
jgi:hypothetical protein